MPRHKTRPLFFAPERTCCVPGCGAPAHFGIGASLLRDTPGLWYCRQHRPPDPDFSIYGPDLEPEPKPEKQGDLFK